MKRSFLLCFSVLSVVLSGFSCTSSAPAKDATPASSQSKEMAEPSLAQAETGVTATDADGNFLARYGTVSLVWDRNIADVKEADRVLVAPQPVSVEWKGEKALKVMANDLKEIRFAWVFAEPVPAGQFAGITYKIGGFDSYSNYNFAVIYDEKESISFFLGNAKKSEWSEIIKKSSQAESWGKPWLSSKKIKAVQFWTNSAKEVYIKDFDFIKKE